MIASSAEGLTIQGPLTVETAKATLEAGIDLLDGKENFTVDLTDVHDVDSSALTVMLELMRQAQKQNKKMRFVNIPANLSSLAVLYNITDLLPN